LALTAAPAQAARIGVFIGAGVPAAYIPPSPGPGYAWVGGYWANGYWVRGYWNHVGYGPGIVVRGGVAVHPGPVFYHRDFYGRFGQNRFRR
jgi:hypothetical protein